MKETRGNGGARKMILFNKKKKKYLRWQMGSLKQQSRLWGPVDAGPIMVPILWCIYPTRMAAFGIASPERRKRGWRRFRPTCQVRH